MKDPINRALGELHFLGKAMNRKMDIKGVLGDRVDGLSGNRMRGNKSL